MKNSNDVLLVNPNQVKPAVAPIALDYIGSVLRAAGYRAQLLDCYFLQNIEVITGNIQRLAKENFLAIAVTIRNLDNGDYENPKFYFEDYKVIVDLLKSSFPGTPIILGGKGFSIAPGKALEYFQVDFGVVGDGEDLILEALRQIRDGIIKPNHLFKHTACAARGKYSRFPLHRDIVDNVEYFRRSGILSVRIRSGCAAQCSFCVQRGGIIAFRSIDEIVAELKEVTRERMDCFYFGDDEFNLPPKFSVLFCEEIISQGVKLSWIASLAPHLLDVNTVLIYKNSGCAGVYLSLGAASDSQLERYQCPWRMDDIAKALGLLDKYRIPVSLDVLIGGPGETMQSINQAIGFLYSVLEARLARRIAISTAIRRYPNTPLSENSNGLKPEFYISPLRDYIEAKTLPFKKFSTDLADGERFIKWWE